MLYEYVTWARVESQMTAAECEKTEDVANFRIHDELAINRIKEFKIVTNTLPINALHLLEGIMKLCSNRKYSSTIN